MRKLVLFLVALPILFGLAVLAASELGGEVVTLYTRDEAGRESRTSLWVVDYGGYPYLRAGDRDAGWCERLRRVPDVRVERGGETLRYRAVPAPEQTPTVDALMAERYGLADRLVGLMRDPGASMAIRLEPASP